MEPNWKRWAGLLGAGMLGLGAAWLGVRQSEKGLIRRYIKVEREDGDESGPVPALSYEPEEATPRTPVTLVAHGFAGSKEIMQFIGSELARQGQRVFMPDLPGHGMSQARFHSPVMDFSNVVGLNVQQLEQVYHYVRQKFPEAAIGLVGHSMGSGAILNFAEKWPGLAAAIPISVAGRQPATPTNPKNLLMLVGERDVPICLSSARELYEKATGEATEGDVELSGSFGNGSARRLKTLPKLDHISILFAPATLREITEWLGKSYGIEKPVQLRAKERLRWTGLGLASSLLAFFPFSRLLTGALGPTGMAKPELRKWSAKEKAGAVAALAAGPWLSVLVWHKAKLPRLVRLDLGDYLVAFFGLSGLLGWAGLSRIGRNRLELRQMSYAAQHDLKAKGLNWVALPFGLWLFVYATFGAFSRRSWYSFRLNPARARAMAIVLASVLPYFLANEATFRRMGGVSGYGLGLLTKFSMLASLILAVRLKPELSFLMLLLFSMSIVFMLFELFAAWQYRQRPDFVTTGVMQAIVFAWVVSTLFPVIE